MWSTPCTTRDALKISKRTISPASSKSAMTLGLISSLSQIFESRKTMLSESVSTSYVTFIVRAPQVLGDPGGGVDRDNDEFGAGLLARPFSVTGHPGLPQIAADAPPSTYTADPVMPVDSSEAKKS